MHKLLQILLCVLSLFSCTGKSDKKSLENRSDVPTITSVEKFDTTSLISFKSEFVMEDGAEVDGYYEDRNSFILPYISRAFNQDTLHVSTLHEVNSCAETVGRIRFSNDSLFLLVEQVGSEPCTSIEFRKYHYVIVKKGIKDYTIVY